jgi:hypothetical protein
MPVTETDRRAAMNQALHKHRDAHGQPAVRELLEKVANATASSLVPEDKIAAVVAACEATPKPRPPSIAALNPKEIYSKWNEGWRRPESAS